VALLQLIHDMLLRSDDYARKRELWEWLHALMSEQPSSIQHRDEVGGSRVNGGHVASRAAHRLRAVVHRWLWPAHEVLLGPPPAADVPALLT
jgi:hypothetical protein